MKCSLGVKSKAGSFLCLLGKECYDYNLFVSQNLKMALKKAHI